MRDISQYAGLVLLMVAARYAPMDRAGELLGLTSQHPLQPQIVTGSVEGATGDQTHRAVQPRTALPLAPAAGIKAAASPYDARAREAVRTIIAQSMSGEPPNAPQAGAPAQQGSSRSKRRGGDQFQELELGGTGLVGSEAAPAERVHPLAAANPDDYVVICEAGCRPQTDKIVYKVSKTAAAAVAIAQRRLEVTAAPSGGDAAPAPDDAVVCVAGCYEKPVKQSKTAAVAPAAPAAPAAPVITLAAATQEAVAAVVAEDVRAIITELSARNLRRAAQTFAWNARPATVVAAKRAAPGVKPAIAKPAPVAPKPEAVLLASQTPEKKSSAKTRIDPVRRTTIVANAAQGWRTSVVRISEPRPASLQAPLRESLSPFETTVSVESGWEWALVQSQ